MYLRAEFFQLTVGWTDSKLEVQKYGTKKNILTADTIMLEDEMRIRRCEKPSPNCWSRFFKNQTAETEFLVFEL